MILCLVGDPLYTAPATPVNGAVCSREVMYVSNMPLKCCVMVGTICGHRVRLGKSIVGALCARSDAIRGAWLPRTVPRLNIYLVSNFRNFMTGMGGAGYGLSFAP